MAALTSELQAHPSAGYGQKTFILAPGKTSAASIVLKSSLDIARLATFRNFSIVPDYMTILVALGAGEFGPNCREATKSDIANIIDTRPM